MEFISKPSITRLARRAGIKSLSNDSYKAINNIIDINLNELLEIILIINSKNNIKTINKNDIYNAFLLKGYNVSYSNDLGTNTFTK